MTSQKGNKGGGEPVVECRKEGRTENRKAAEAE